jgi:hypothetical protein
LTFSGAKEGDIVLDSLTDNLMIAKAFFLLHSEVSNRSCTTIPALILCCGLQWKAKHLQIDLFQSNPDICCGLQWKAKDIQIDAKPSCIPLDIQRSKLVVVNT